MIVTAKIEIPMGCSYKYEIKKGKIYLDRPVYKNLPANYGYVINTFADDMDPLDIFVISQHPIVPGALVKVQIFGIYQGFDSPFIDDKVIGVLVGEENNPHQHTREEIYKYLSTYKKGFEVTSELRDDKMAALTIGRCRNNFKRLKEAKR